MTNKLCACLFALCLVSDAVVWRFFVKGSGMYNALVEGWGWWCVLMGATLAAILYGGTYTRSNTKR